MVTERLPRIYQTLRAARIRQRGKAAQLGERHFDVCLVGIFGRSNRLRSKRTQIRSGAPKAVRQRTPSSFLVLPVV